jgi:type VI secretion system secreted protein Hcp
MIKPSWPGLAIFVPWTSSVTVISFRGRGAAIRVTVEAEGVMAIYAKIKGKTQGDLNGGVAATGYSGQIQINSCEFGVGSPFDVATGQATGKRTARPVNLTKPVDKSSPLLYTSCTTNESLTVDIAYIKEGEGHGAFLTVKLTGAMIRDFNHQASFDGTAVEVINLTYTKIEFTWVDGGIMSVDDWSAAS